MATILYKGNRAMATILYKGNHAMAHILYKGCDDQLGRCLFSGSLK